MDASDTVDSPLRWYSVLSKTLDYIGREVGCRQQSNEILGFFLPMPSYPEALERSREQRAS